MALSRGTSNGPDVVDVASVMVAFEEQNRVCLVVTLRTCKGLQTPDFWLEGKALSWSEVNGVRSLLAFASVRCGSMNLKSTDAALLNLLYQLDFQLGELEVKKATTLAKLAPPRE